MPTTLTYSSTLSSAPLQVFIGRREQLASDAVRSLLPDGVPWDAMLESCSTGDAGASASTFTGDGRLVVGVLPEPCSRHNSPARPHAVTSLVSGALSGKDDAQVVLVLEHATHALAAGAAVARALPRYTRKKDEGTRIVGVGFVPADGDVSEDEYARVAAVAEGIRLAASLFDMPPDVLHTDAFVDTAREVAQQVGASIEVIAGDELVEKGYGGLWGVGKAATHKPALAVLTWDPPGATETLAWVGKGIVYDTGGLSIKTKTGMPGMKGDMGGAGAVLGAFQAAATRQAKQRIHALLCLAENSVGPDSTRPDDILEMYSGKTVEVNNTDAEGRLVLADGVAHATKHLSPDVVVDMATLTGAQLMATGKRHAALVCNDDELEARAVAAGKVSGDLTHPLPYVPEFFRKEFKSEIADLKNSVKDRMNAQSSCAGQFVAEHLVEHDGAWLHIDLAGPAGYDNGRGTGYGVALLAELFGF